MRLARGIFAVCITGKETHDVIPPPPSLANARAAINSVMFLAKPQNRLLRSKAVNAKTRHAFRPTMSLILPYSGLNNVV